MTRAATAAAGDTAPGSAAAAPPTPPWVPWWNYFPTTPWAPSPKSSSPGPSSPRPPASSPPPGSPAPSTALPSELQAALNRTNLYRIRHQVPPATWDAAIAAQAARYAAGCPLGHSGTRGVGENLAWGYPSFAAVVDAWYNEVRRYNFARGGYSSGTGHFTQLVWKSSTRIGCAVSTRCRSRTYVCQYAPQGNIINADWSKQVLPALAAPSPTPKPASPAPGSTLPTQPSTPPAKPSPSPPPPKTAVPSPPPSGLSEQLQTVLDRTNAYRRRHQVPPVVWDAAIAAQAAGYAARCPRGHSGMRGVGENLAWGFASFGDAVKAWYDENRMYNYRSGGFSSATGHFTQLVWKDTTRMGCALNLACSMRTYVCQYAPQGNIMGVNWASQVKPPIAAVPMPGQAGSVAALPSALPLAHWKGLADPSYQGGEPYTVFANAAPPVSTAAVSEALQAAVDLSNWYRSRHQAQPLEWDATLALNAADWASKCANGLSNTTGVSENVAYGYASLADAIDAFYAESALYNHTTPGYSVATGHFTNLVWAGSSKVGCAINPSCQWTTYVCQYGPPGNVLTADWASSVRPAVSSAPAAGLPLPSLEPSAPLLDSPATGLAQAVGAAVPLAFADVLGATAVANQLRALYGAPSLRWDNLLAQTAQAAAQRCPGRDAASGAPGQAVAWGVANLVEAIRGWYGQGSDWQVSGADHASIAQLLLSGSDRFGCAYAECAVATYVCQFWPGSSPVQGPADAMTLNGNPLGSAVDGTTSSDVDASDADLPDAAGVPTFDEALDAAIPDAAIPGTATASDLATAVGTTTAPTAVTGLPLGAASALSDDLQAALDETNAHRSRHEAPPLQWDNDLAANAAEVADACPMVAFEGQNVAIEVDSVAQAVELWYDTVSNYNWSEPGPSPMAGPFAQLVWKNATRMGCSLGTACTARVAVCVYDTSGDAASWADNVRPTGTGVDPVVLLGPQPPPALVPMLARSNDLRGAHGAAPLSWDPALAASAEAVAEGCPASPSYTADVGENLAFGHGSWVEAVDAWYREGHAYEHDAPGYQRPAQHFTQLVWAGSTKVGCAVNEACAVRTYVCHYNPAGNVPIDDWTRQVAQALAPVQLPPAPQGEQLPLFPQVSGLEPTLQAGLDAVNRLRSHHRVSPLQWSEELARSAAAWAVSCPTEHSPAAAASVGEAIGWNRSSLADSVVEWYSTGSSYPWAAPGFSAAAGYFTQLVWRGTLRIGCARNEQCTFATDVCQFDPPGNVIGDNWAAQVKPPAAMGSVQAVPLPLDPTSWLDMLTNVTPAGNLPDLLPPAVAAVTSPAPGGISLSSELQSALDVTNSHRANHGVAPVQWDTALASQAARFASRCPYGHSGTRGVGENLAWGFRSFQAAVDAWYNEVNIYNFNRQGFSSATGHFTQLVWKSTTSVGCAVNTRCRSRTYVCQYRPPGNVIGVNWASQVLRPGTPYIPGNATRPPSSPTPAVRPPPPVAVTPSPSPPLPVVPSPPAPTVGGYVPADPVLAAVLERHNFYRARHGVPLMTWDNRTGEIAQAYAARCPGGHSGRRGLGENLAWGYTTFVAGVDAWYAEVRSYNFRRGGFSSATGHFTQMVWRDSTKLGCGYNKRCGMATYVCNYSPQGNIIGRDWTTQVPAPVK